MKHLVAVLGLFALIGIGTINSACAQPSKQYETNWFEIIVNSLTGTQATTESPKITHTTISKKHHRKIGHRRVNTTHKSHASAGVTKFHAHTNQEDKLFKEFQVWYKKYQWEETLKGKLE